MALYGPFISHLCLSVLSVTVWSRVISDATGPRKCNNNSSSSSTSVPFRLFVNKSTKGSSRKSGGNFGIEFERLQKVQNIPVTSSSLLLLSPEPDRWDFLSECQSKWTVAQYFQLLFQTTLFRTRIFFKLPEVNLIFIFYILRIVSFVGFVSIS